MTPLSEPDAAPLSSGASDRPWTARLGAAQGRGLAAGLLALFAFFYFFYGETLWRAPRDYFFDLYQLWRPRVVERFPVAIIDIDDPSLTEFGPWPWPRNRLAQLVTAIHKFAPLAVGLDIILPEADNRSPQALLLGRPDIAPELRAVLARLPSNDQLLADALRQGPSVVARAGLAARAKPAAAIQQTALVVRGEPPHGAVPTYQGQLTNIPEIEAAAQGHAYVNDTRDDDGVIRTTPLVFNIDGTLAPALAIELLRVATGEKQFLLHADRTGMLGVQIGSQFIPTERNGRIRIYYSPAYMGRRISAAAILRGAVPAGALNNQIAIVGVSGLGSGDVVATPIAARVDGVEVHAQIIENILAGNQLFRPAQALRWELSCLLLLGATVIAWAPKLSPSKAVGCFAAICPLLLLASFLLFYRWRWLIDLSFCAAGSGVILMSLLTTGHMVANRRRRELSAALAIETDQRLRRDGELDAARQIQMGMLPNPKQIAGLPPALDFFALVEPAQEVGGDFYEAVMLDSNRLFFMIGDVAGKGVPAALFMALTKTLAKSMARREAALNRLLTLVNREVSSENPAAQFVTLIVGVLDARTGVFEWCNAGHHPPLLLHPLAAPRELAGAQGPPLCVDEDFVYRTQHFQLAADDTLLFVTDGVSEAENRAQQQYGMERVRARLANFPQSAEACCLTLHADVKRFVAGAPCADDLTIMALAYRPGERAASLRL